MKTADTCKHHVELKIVPEDDPMDPRDSFDNLGKMVCWHKRYRLGDAHEFHSPEAFQEEINDKNAIILPLYLLDHSGLSISTRSFGDPWDSGQVGWIYATLEDIRKEFKVKRISKKLRKKVEESLENEVRIYDDYLRGDVWGFVLEKVFDCECHEGYREHIDSCFGFYGDMSDSSMREYIPKEYRHLLDDAWYSRGYST